MLFELTLTQLQVDPGSEERTRELGQLGYMQWLGGLPAEASYEAEAARAYRIAVAFEESDPAVAVFCELLRESLNRPLHPLDLALPKPRRRGGARERRRGL